MKIFTAPLFRLFTALALVGGLAGCGAMSAQNPSGSLKPVNAVEMPPAERVMLQGADVVAYFTAGGYRAGRGGPAARPGGSQAAQRSSAGGERGWPRRGGSSPSGAADPHDEHDQQRQDEGR